MRDKDSGGCVARRIWCILFAQRVHHGAQKSACRMRVSVKYLGRLSKGVRDGWAREQPRMLSARLPKTGRSSSRNLTSPTKGSS